MTEDPQILRHTNIQEYESAVAALNILKKTRGIAVSGTPEICVVPSQYSSSFTNFRDKPPPTLDGRPMLRLCFPFFSGFESVRKLFSDAGLGDAVINPKYQPGWVEYKDGTRIEHHDKGGILENDSAHLYFDLLYLEQPEQLQKLKALERVGPRTGRTIQ